MVENGRLRTPVTLLGPLFVVSFGVHAQPVGMDMCGRYVRKSPPQDFARLFGAEGEFDLEPAYNVAPSQNVLVARNGENDVRELALLRWGLVPFWAKDPSLGYRTINARMETVASKPAFRAAFKRRRCLVPEMAFTSDRP